MGKGAGFWKKVKKVATEIGDGASKAFAWLNTNILQPLKPIIGNVIDMFDESGLGSKVFNVTTDVYDNYLEQTDQKPDDGFSKFTEIGKDLFEYTQNPNRYKRNQLPVPPLGPKRKQYNKAFDPSLELNSWDDSWDD